MSSEPPVEQPAELPKPAPNRNRHRTLRRLVVLGAVLALAGAVLGFFAQRSALSPDDPPEKTYQKIFDAYGGQKALDRWKCGVLKYEVLANAPGGSQTETSVTHTFWLPGKEWHDVIETRDGRKLRVWDGTNGIRSWTKVENERVNVFRSEFGPTEYPLFVLAYHPYWVLREGKDLSIKGVELRGDGGRDLLIEVPDPGKKPIVCRVDLKTKLLRERDGPTHSPLTNEPLYSRCEYSDYRETDGGPVPGRIVARYQGITIFEMRFVSVVFKESVSIGQFDPPEGPDK